MCFNLFIAILIACVLSYILLYLLHVFSGVCQRQHKQLLIAFEQAQDMGRCNFTSINSINSL